MKRIFHWMVDRYVYRFAVCLPVAKALRGCLNLGESATDPGLRESLEVGSRPFPGAPQ